MANFCSNCGSPLEEGQVCACQSNQAAPVATAAPAAAVSSVHFLAAAEILCVALGIVTVLLLPKRNAIKEN